MCLVKIRSKNDGKKHKTTLPPKRRDSAGTYLGTFGFLKKMGGAWAPISILGAPGPPNFNLLPIFTYFL